MTRRKAKPAKPRKRPVYSDDFRAGVLACLDANGGNVDRALASYYQGLRSVREHGMLDETRRFVANVKALRGRL